MSLIDFNLNPVKSDLTKDNPHVSTLGYDKWFNLRKTLLYLIKNFKQIGVDNLKRYFDMEYTFYGIKTNNLFWKRNKTEQSIYVRVFDPDLDNTGFCKSGCKFDYVGPEWLKENMQGMNNVNSINFNEFAKLLLSIKEGYVKPKFNLDFSKLTRKKNSISTPDGRVTIEWSETFDEYSLPIPLLSGIFCACLLVFAGVLRTGMITYIFNMYFPGIFGLVELCFEAGKFVKLKLSGDTITKLKKYFGKRKYKQILGRIFAVISGKSRKVLALPPGTKPLPFNIVGLLPPVRPG
jgi:hypothetical protein